MTPKTPADLQEKTRCDKAGSYCKYPNMGTDRWRKCMDCGHEEGWQQTEAIDKALRDARAKLHTPSPAESELREAIKEMPNKFPSGKADFRDEEAEQSVIEWAYKHCETIRSHLERQAAGEGVEKELCGDEVNGGFIRDLCFTVWTLCHNPKHEDGNTDWANDTLPIVQKGVAKIREKLRRTQGAAVDVEAIKKQVSEHIHKNRKSNDVEELGRVAEAQTIAEMTIDLLAAQGHLPAPSSEEPDVTKCPGCKGPADNGHDRCYPPNPYHCTKCEQKGGSE